jgi:hypothetical protein
MYDNNGSSTVHEMNEGRSAVRSETSYRFRPIEEHLFSDLNGEAVILSLKNGKYYGLNEVGMTIWQAVSECSTLQEIEAAVIAEYEVEPETCSREVRAFVDNLIAEGLIEMAPDG